MILSEDFESGYGWSYTGWLNALSEDTGISSEELGKIIVDDMIADNEENGEGASTLALIDESYMKVLYTAWADFAYANEPALLGENYSMHVRGGRRAHPVLREKGLFDFLFDEDGDYSMSDYYITDIMAVAQNIESKEAEALAAAVNLSICYFNCTDDEVGMTGLSVTLPYGDSEFYGYLYPVFTGVGMDADYVGWLEKFVYAEGYNDYYDYESWYEDDWEGWDDYEDDWDWIEAELERRREQAQTPEIAPKADTMLDAAAEVEKAYTDAIQQTGNDPVMDNLPREVQDKVKTFWVNPQFREDIETLQIPQFFLKIEKTLFTDGTFELLDKEMLAEGFTLKGKAYDIDFAAADDEIREIDVREQDGGLPKVFKMESAEQRYFKECFSKLPPENRVRQCKDMMFKQLNKLNMVDAAELKAYIDRIVDDMDKAQLAAMEKAPLGYAAKIRDKIETLLEAHYRENFEKWLETERIVCTPSFRLPLAIHPTTHTDIYARSLYTAEDGDMNRLEEKLIVELTALQNVRWWHRNIARQGFAINGFIKHYPDILIMTQSGKLICAETKGEHLKNDDSREKIALGQAWSSHAGSQFRYYMVFMEENNLLTGAVSMSKFLEIVSAL